ncbi:hypothetical protein JTL74_32765, partial [Pseudomonas aeruginosa]|nr:hypothetical protein [Pseudomonas aeruginosa]
LGIDPNLSPAEAAEAAVGYLFQMSKDRASLTALSMTSTAALPTSISSGVHWSTGKPRSKASSSSVWTARYC